MSLSAVQHSHRQDLLASILVNITADITAVYRLIGLEQTVESKPLPEYPFPQKSVLVLGRESSGIPPEILQVRKSRTLDRTPDPCAL